MAELLYLPAINPPSDVLHHAILYRDLISTLVPDEFEGHLSDPVRRAAEAGLYRPLPARETWNDFSVQRDAWNAVWTMVEGRSDYISENFDVIKQRILTMARAMSDSLGNGECTRHPLATTAEDTSRSNAAALRVDHLAWRGLVGEVFDEIWRSRCLSDEVDDWSGTDGMAWSPSIQAALLVGTGYGLAAQAHRDPVRPLLVPHHDRRAIGDIVQHCAVVPRADHLLHQIDVGQLLPNPAPGVDTAALINFRERYDDERRRLVNAVERLIESSHYERPEDIEGSVRRDLKEAIADMTRAGRGVLRGWSRRVISTVTAAGASTAVGGLAGAPVLLTAILSSAGSIAINLVTNPISQGWRDDKFASYHYLYRVCAALDADVHRRPELQQ
ncbi:hypothetical protein SAMN05421810_1202 [Amycolatopsis arida]|uniref:Uncharacterized protein n=1 Tax=Amycolatopsis arida TaxID=587909 RepID=A0A1I6B249_9PSEU|nr:hypothetical protein [Amycolatopsis arida]TDX83552.1 hypothetical protein CLV69_1224 [Amycolatopsis arida]SFQ75042.1 hypothetical protein SAMN05421810_1202 [Amycolatopsis arida]